MEVSGELNAQTTHQKLLDATFWRRTQFLRCPAYNPVTTPVCYHGFYTKRSIPHNFHPDSHPQKHASEICYQLSAKDMYKFIFQQEQC
jgi:hypothetical protein